MIPLSQSMEGTMAEQTPPAADPDNVPEILCDGQVNVAVSGELATLTFTHIRPDPGAMFRDGSIDPRSIVRARIVLTLANLAAFRDVLNRLTQGPDLPAALAGESTQH
jgi:hypothetical protein